MWDHALGIKLYITLAKLGILPEDGPMGTETCRRFYGIFGILICVNIF